MARSMERAFKDIHKKDPDFVCKVPGRINIIGDHTDYNGGDVLPMTINLFTEMAVRKSKGSFIFQSSYNSDEFNNAEINFDPQNYKGFWFKYIIGMIDIFQKHFNVKVPPFMALVHSTIPVGAGLSSSAALVIAAFNACANLTGDRKKYLADLDQVALLCQKVEHEWADTPCGLMDQTVILNGKMDHAVYINFHTNEKVLVPIDLSNYSFLVVDSGLKHDLSDGKYKQRRMECEAAAKILDVKTIGEYKDDATKKDITEMQIYFAQVNSETEYQRAFHVVSEIERVRNFKDALKINNIQELGKIMYASHASLRMFFEVSRREIDDIVEDTKQVDGVAGARMTGGGFGGCVIVLVQSNKVDDVKENLSKTHKGLKFYHVQAVDGPKVN